MPAEVFDEERRAWIAARAGIWMFQKRRAELLGKRIRARSRAKVGARPDPHDDQVTRPAGVPHVLHTDGRPGNRRRRGRRRGRPDRVAAGTDALRGDRAGSSPSGCSPTPSLR